MSKILRVNTLIFCIIGTFFGQTVFAMEQTFYKWEDKDGSTHYTLSPPPKGMKSLGKMKTYRDFSPNLHHSMPPRETTKTDKTAHDQSDEKNTTPTGIPEVVPQPQIIRPIIPQVPASQLPLTIKQNGREYLPLPR